MKINQFINCTPSFQVLAEDQIERLFFSALDVLERTGVRLPEGEWLDLVRESRAWLSSGSLVRFPATMVQESLRSHPAKINLTGRNQAHRLRLQKDEVHFGSGSRLSSVLDRSSQARREAGFEDVLEAARVVDALTHFDFCMAAPKSGRPKPSRIADGRIFLAMLQGCTKPLLTMAEDAAGLEVQWAMAARLRDRDELRLNPLFMDCTELEVPLCPSRTALEKLMLCAEKDIPCLVSPCLAGGVNAPLSLAGCLVLALASCFAGSVLASLKRPGLPITFAPRFELAGPDGLSLSSANPEIPLTQAAFTDIVKWLQIPVASRAGCSDAKLLDGQAALEMATSLYYAFLSGSNLIQSVGSVDFGRTQSLEGMIFCNEAIGMIKQIGKGIGTEEEHLALNLIEEIGPGGEYLTAEHTLDHFRDWFRPRLLDRSSLQAWVENGRKSMADRIRRETDRVLAEHRPEALDAEALREMEAMLQG